MSIGLSDVYGNIVTTDSQSKLSMQVTQYNNSDVKNEFPPTLAGFAVFYSNNGIFAVNDVVLTGTPGVSYSVYFATDGIDVNKPANAELISA